MPSVMPLAALDYYEIEEVEALARACLQGAHRHSAAVGEDEAVARTAEDSQDAEAFRVLFYTGVRLGELLTLRWADVDFGPGPCSSAALCPPVLRPSPRGAAVAMSHWPTRRLGRLPAWARVKTSAAPTTTCSPTALAAASIPQRCGAATTSPVRPRACDESSCTDSGTRWQHPRPDRRPGVRARLSRAFEAEHHRPLRQRQAPPGGLRTPESGLPERARPHGFGC
jgi:hypothetical protein